MSSALDSSNSASTSSSWSVWGLHGHRPGTNAIGAVVAEGFGTFVLVLVIISAAIAAALSRSIVGAPYGSLAVPLAGGLALASLVASLGRISGGHLNPAVTLGLAVHRRFKWAYVPSYLAAQLVGATVAAAVAWSLYGGRARTTAHLGATYPSTGTGLGRALLAETVVTFVLVWVVVSVGSNPKASPAISAVAIGFALAAAIFIAGPVSGGAVNPARALGPMLVSGKFTDWWIYLVGPVLGAVAAVGLYRGLGDERA